MKYVHFIKNKFLHNSTILKIISKHLIYEVKYYYFIYKKSKYNIKL